MKTAFVAKCCQSRFDLLARAVYEHELHAERGEQIEIVREIEEAAVRNDISAKRDDERLAAKSMYVGRYRLEPVDEPVLARKPLTPNALRVCTAGVAARTALVRIGNGALLLARRGVATQVFRREREFM